MLPKILSHPIFYTLVTATVLLGVLVCVFPHLLPSLSWGVNYAVHIMLLFLFAGLLMLFLRQPKLTFVFFGGCALLCIFLKYSVKSDGIVNYRNTPANQYNSTRSTEPASLSVEFKVAHFNLTNVENLAVLTAAVKKADADLVSIHEVTPDWDGWLNDSLGQHYPFHHTMVDIGIFGMAIYSKYPLEELDTFTYQEIPNLQGCLAKDGEELCFVSVHTEPALNAYSLRRLQEHLDVVGREVLATELPVLVLGDFNAVSWSGEIQNFLSQTGLMESRTGFMPYPFVGTSSLFKIPLDHIFYSGQFYCTGFENLVGQKVNHLGILGSYHRKSPPYHAKKTSR